MGPSPAVSRYHQQHRFFMQNDTPNLWDHDFPHAGYLITTSGYQMQVKEDVGDNQTNQDDEMYTRDDLNDYSVNPDSADFQELGGMTLVKDQYWKGAVFNGSKITTLVKKSLEEETPYCDYVHVHKVRQI